MSKPRTWTKEKVLKIADALGLDTKVVRISPQQSDFIEIKAPLPDNAQCLKGYNQLWAWLTEDDIFFSPALNAIHVQMNSLQKSDERTDQTTGLIDLTKVIKEAKKKGLTVKQCDFEVQILKDWNNVDHVLPFSDMAKALSKVSIKFRCAPALGNCQAIIIPVRIFAIPN